MVDVTTTIEIRRPVEEVARYAANPSNAPAWYANIHTVEWETAPTLTVGARVRFVASFLGRRLRYTYEVLEYLPNARLVMATARGPFAMRTTYTWEPAGARATTMTLRNSGEPAGFSRILTPLLAPAMRRANRTDLRRLKAVLERDRHGALP